jgi:DNA-binding response OmpR family regulator
MRILIIENDLNVNNFLKNGLESQLYVVDSVNDGEKGLFFAKTNQYDLIVLNSKLPKLSGFEILKQIRENKNSTPIIVISSSDNLADKKAMYDLGADDYLVKPVAFQELMFKIKAILNRPPIIKTSVLRLNDLALDEETKIVKRGKQKINLTKKEYNLLRFLLNRKGQVVSKTEIMEKVWNVNANPFSNSIEAHIMNLRKKLNMHKDKNYIHTLNGRGYKLDLSKL